MKRLLCAVAAVLVPTAAFADNDPQQWTGLSATVKLDTHWRISEELVTRFSNKREGLYEIESNTLIGYALNDHVTVWAGYTHDPQYAGGDFTVMERRGRQQVTFDNIARVLGGNVSLRLRTEERWREGIDGTAYRVRPYVKFALPFHKGSRTSLVLSHESFVDLNATPFQRREGEERMRNLVAISTKLDRHTTAEFGYLNQQSFVDAGEAEDDHVASVALAFAF
jgi:hypothetical protein